MQWKRVGCHPLFQKKNSEERNEKRKENPYSLKQQNGVHLPLRCSYLKLFFKKLRRT